MNGSELPLKQWHDRIFQAFLTHAPVIVFALDREGKILFAEGRGLSELGLRQSEVAGRSAFELNKDYPHILINLRRALSGESFTATIEFQDRFFEVRFESPPARTSEDVAVLGVATDITERVLIERVLRNRGDIVERLNLSLVELAKNEHIYKGDISLAYRVITEAAARAMMTERTSIWFYTDDQTGIRCADLYELKSGLHSSGYVLGASQYPAYFRALLEGTVIDAHDARSDPRTREFTESYLLPLGIRSMLDVPIRVSGRSVGVVCHEHVGQERIWTREEQSFVTAVAGFVSTAIETHERLKAENSLRAAEQRLRDIVEHSTNLFYMHAPDHRLLYVSPQSRVFLDCEPEEALVRWTEFLTDNPANERGLSMTDAAIETGIAQQPYELELRGFKGRVIWVEVREAPIVKNGRTVAVVGALSDITERKRMEKEMIKSQKLESLGILAGGIAHDFNNVLTVILGNISLAHLLLTPDDPASGRLDQAEKACLQARDLTQQLLTFSKGGSPVRTTLRVEQILQDSAGLAVRGSNVKCTIHCADSIHNVDADAGQMTQVFNNIILNASQAMAEGGTIRIEAENADIGPEGGLPLNPGTYVKINVTDGGPGIPEGHLQRIFDPYFTTKKKGSGLGLSVAYSIVKNHEGHIDVHSVPYFGTTFSVYLPASRKQPGAEPQRESIEPAAGRRVLVMDDEEMVRDIAGAMLRHFGFETVLTGDGSKAVSLFRQAKESGEPFDVVILDLTVSGGMGGKEALRHMLAADPDVKAVVSSGYSNDDVIANYRAYGFTDVITKPYKSSELRAVLGRLVSG